MASLRALFASYRIKWVSFTLTLLMLSGCGFHLKQASDMPADLTVIQLQGADTRSALFEQLQTTLKQNDIALSNQANLPVLYLHPANLERSTLSLFRNGQVAEYGLTYRVSYSLTRPNQTPIEKQFELYRNYQDDPDFALAKSREMTLIIRELRQQASQRIVRELSQL